MGAFGIAEVPGSCKLLATLGGDEEKATGGLAIIDLTDSKPRLDQMVSLPTAAVGLTLSKDHRLAIVAGGDRLYVFSLPDLFAGRAAPPAVVQYATKPGTVSVALTPDERFLFASDEGAGKITVLDFDRMRRSGFSSAKVISSIAVDYAPTVLAASPDGRFVYVPVQGILRRYGPPILCRSEGGTDPTPVNPIGGILAIDVAKSVSKPDQAIVARAYAGCSPVRLALSRDGRTIWVTNRLGDTVRALDATDVVHSPTKATRSIVNVGRQPIGVALLHGDRIVAVANADRWDPDQTKPKTVSFFSARGALARKRVVPLTMSVGIFPRDLSSSGDGETLYVSNFGSRSIDIVPASQLMGK